MRHQLFDTPILGLGMAALGRPEYINIDAGNRPEKNIAAFKQNALSVLDFAYANGIRYIDTAPGYGAAEAFLKEWRDKTQPEEIIFGTKWGYTYTANWALNASQHEVKEHSLSKLNEQWTTSIDLTPQLRIYQIHSATFETGVLKNDAILNRLNELKNQENLLIGLTVSGPQQSEVLKKAFEIEIAGQPLFDVYQLTYNMLEQSCRDIAIQLRDAGKVVIIKEALANGRIFPNYNFPDYQMLYRRLENMADQYEAGIDAIALRYVFDTIQPSVVLSGASNIPHLDANLKATTIALDEASLSVLDMERVGPDFYWEERKQLGWN